jgi:hypothetical protein
MQMPEAAAAPREASEVEELKSCTVAGKSYKVIGHAPLVLQGGVGTGIPAEMLQEVKGGTTERPGAGTKLYPWLFVFFEWSDAAPSAQSLFDDLRKAFGDSVLYFGVVCRENVATVLVHKTKVRVLTIPNLGCGVAIRGIVFPKGKGSMEIVKACCFAVDAWCALEGEHVTTISLEVPKQPEKKSVKEEQYASAQEAFDFVKDLRPRQFAFMCADLKLKVKQEKVLSPVERTILVIRSDLEALRESRARAKSFLRVHNEDATDLVYPDSFDLLALSKIQGTHKDRTGISINEYVTTTMHLRLTAVLCGPPEVGKSPLAAAIALRLARMYQDGDDEAYVVTSTPDSLRMLADEDLLRAGVPVIFEELEAKDRKSHARPLTANVMKHLCGVTDTGCISARYRDFVIHQKQPRLICCNSSPDDWLAAITEDARDKAAIEKRCIFFEFEAPVLVATAGDARDVEYEDFLAAGHSRLALKLGQSL